MDKKQFLDGRAGAIKYFLPSEERFLPAVEVPDYALVVISLKRNVGSFVFLSKHIITHDNEWAVPVVINGKRMEFLPKYLSEIYTLDGQSQLRSSLSDSCILAGVNLSTDETVKLINGFSQELVYEVLNSK